MKQQVYRKAFKRAYDEGEMDNNKAAASNAHAEMQMFLDRLPTPERTSMSRYVASMLFDLLYEKHAERIELQTRVYAHEAAFEAAASDASRGRRLHSEDEEGEPVPVRRRRVKVA